MTEGRIGAMLLRFSIPMLLSSMFQQMYNMADSIIAGNFVSEGAVSAIGASHSLTMIFMAVAFGCNIGAGVIVSQLFGAKKMREMKTAVYTALISTAVIALILTVLGFLFCEPVMRLLNTPGEIFDDAMTYLRIYIGGIVFLFVYNICTGIFSALGDSNTPLYFLIGSSLGNIALDVVLVTVIPMGVAGVAWATFIAQGTASVLSLFCLMRRLRTVKTEGAIEKFSFPMFKKLARIAVPSVLQQSSISVGNVLIQGLINTYGSGVVAGISSALRLNVFAVTSFNAFSNSMSSFAAQNIGAGKYDRVRTGFRYSLLFPTVLAVLMLAGYVVFAPELIGLFISNPSADAMNAGCTFLRIVAPFYPVVMVKIVTDGVLRGAGAMKHFFIATFADLLIRVVGSYALSAIFGQNGTWWSWPIGWSIASVISFMFYLSGVWRRQSRLTE